VEKSDRLRQAFALFFASIFRKSPISFSIAAIASSGFLDRRYRWIFFGGAFLGLLVEHKISK
jgi:hypothetical protein